MCNPDAIPEALKALDQWVCWREQERDGKQTKVPVDPTTSSFASVADSETWADFETALAKTADESITGVGFVFTEQDSFVGIDLDGCRDVETGDVEEWAQKVIDTLDSFTEVSPSGTGFHIFVRGKLPEGGNRSGQVECYESARFFTVTGEHVDGTPTQIHERPVALRQVHSEYVVQESTSATSTPVQTPDESSLDDEDLLRKAMAAKNGAKFERLWRGDTTGYDSHSEADMALCCLLAFWTGGEISQLDRLFRRSDLYRPKWDEPHYADGRTYGEGTAERAVARTLEYYQSSSKGAAGGSSDWRKVQTKGIRSPLQQQVSTPEEQFCAILEQTTSQALLRQEIGSLSARVELFEDEIGSLEKRLEHELKLQQQLRHRVESLEREMMNRYHGWWNRLLSK